MKKINKKKAIVVIGLVVMTLLLFVGSGIALNGYFGGGQTVAQDQRRGMVGFWKFDDGAGQTTDDSSDLNNDGTRGANSTEASDDPTWSSSKADLGGVLDFDGTNDIMNVGDDIDFEFPGTTDKFSIAAWIKTDTTPSATNYTIAGKYNSAGDREYYLLIDSSNQPVLFMSEAGGGDVARTETSGTAITVGSWAHVAVSVDFDTDVYSMYINGVQVTTTSAGAAISTLHAGTARFIVGAVDSESTTPDWFMDGKIDEVRVYNRALSAAEIRYLYNYGGPVAHYKMDEGAGSTTAYDATNISNDGTITGATYAAGQYGTALDFDGTDDVVTVTNTSPIDFDVGLRTAVTFSSWINADNAGEGSAGQFIWKGTNTWIRVDTLSGGRLDVEASLDLATTDATLNISSAIATASWNHIVMSYTDDADDEITIFINGINVGSSTNGVGAPAGTDTSNLLIAGTTTNNFDGKIDDVKVYTYERSGAEVLLDYNQGFAAEFGPSASPNQDVKRGLVGFWKLDDGAGQTTDDSSDLNNDGTRGADSTAAADDPTWSSGKAGLGGALDFDGTDDLVNVPDAASLDFGASADFTLVGWFNRDTATTLDTIVAKRATLLSLSLGYAVYLDDVSDKVVFEVSDGTDEYELASTLTFTTTGWNHFVVVWDDDSAANSEIYINGVADNATDTGTIGNIDDLSNASNLAIGSLSLVGNFFDGKIDEVRVYNRALSAAEIRYLYNYGGPVAHYKMDEGAGSTTAYDATNISNDGTITGATYAAGQYGTALDFDGTDDVVTVTNTSPIDFDVGLRTAVTFSSWINADNAGEGSAGQFIWKGTNTWIRVDTLSGGRLDVEASLDLATTDATLNISSAIATASWNHIVMSYTDDADDEITIFINGINVGSSTNGVGAPAGTDTSNLLIAGTTTNNFDGKIDDVKVYTYERSGAEVLQDYNVGLSSYFR